MNNFYYASPVHVYFGKNSLETAFESELGKVGKNVMLAYGGGSIKRNGIYDQVVTLLKQYGKNILEFDGIMPNPTYEKVQEGAKIVNENQIDFILAVGGGSVIDCCKIISAQAKVSEGLWEREFGSHVLPTEGIPWGSVVTVTGTGAEMNNAAGITNEALNVKTAIHGTYAQFTVLDPSYTMTVPFEQFLSGAFDTLSHCMETYFGKNENVSDDMNEAVMRDIIKNIRKAVLDPSDEEARSELAWMSSLAENGILRLGKVTDFQCHSIEHQLCAYTNCNHGKALAVLHPVVYRHIYKNNPSAFARFARNVWGIGNDQPDKEAALMGIQALGDFIAELKLPQSFTDLGLEVSDETLMTIAQTCRISQGCMKQLSPEEILEILKECR